MITPQFIHLACHTEYSLVDGLIRIEELIDSAKKAKIPACAITDQSNLFALVKFYMKAQKAGIKPIIGSDLWLDADTPSQFILLCQNLQGYRNLTQLISKSYLEGQRDNIPYIKKEWLSGKTDGLIAILGQSSDLGAALIAENHELAKNHLEFWQTLFPQRLYLGLQRIGKTNEENYIYEAVTLASTQNLPVVATNAVCFLHEDDFEAHEVRVCIRESSTLNDPRRTKKYTSQQYLRSPAEMVELFADIPEAIENTWYIAQRCNLQLTLGKNFLPDFPVPAGKTTEEYFCEQAQLGLEERLAQQNITSEAQQQLYKDRLEQELKVILQMGFPGYFLIVADFIQWAKNHNIPVGPGRGSGAGSLVAYTLKITDLDPLPYDLLFERFLNPERVSMPDFDVDFCMIGRDDVIDYVAERYGRDRVSQIITYGTMAAKAVVRDVGRVLGHPYGFVDQIAKLIPFELGITLDKALDDTPELQQRYETDEDVTTLIDMARKLEGLTRNVGTHAGGVVIAPSQLTDFSPLYCEEGSQDIVTQFDKDDIEKVGLVKFDFLGLRTLTIIKWALENINRYRDEPLDINKIPLDDKKAFELLKRADTTAVFQLESDGLKELIKRLKPDCFEDIVALVALYRPGPLQSGMVDDFIDRKHGRAKIEYPHPELAPVLKPTYGVIVYQEQVMQIAQVLAGYTLGGADILRRCLSGSTQVLDSQTGNLVTLREIAADRANWLGRQVFSLDLTMQQIVTSSISEIYPNGVREVWEITTRTHRKIRATADHLFYTLLGWKPLQDFKVGDRIGLAKTLPIFHSSSISDAQIKLIAYLIGDGHLSTKKITSCYFCNSDLRLITDFNDCVHRLFGRTAQVDQQEHPGHKTVFYVRVGWISGFNQWIDAHVLRAHSHDKEIPAWVFSLSTSQLQLFLGTLWSTDGSFDLSIGHTDYNSTSPKLIQQVQHLLLRLGIVGLFNVKKISYQGKPHISYRVQVTGREDFIKFYAQIQPFLSAEKAEKAQACYLKIQSKIKNYSKHTIPTEVIGMIATFKQQSGMSWAQIDQAVGGKPGSMSSGLNFQQSQRSLSRHRVLNFAIAFKNQQLIAIANSDVFWDEIVAIEPVGQEEVFDLSIPQTHNFIANDFIVHNCMGKKNPEEMAMQRQVFVGGAENHGVKEQEASYIFDLMEKFAAYGFNKCLSSKTLVADSSGELCAIHEWYEQQNLNLVASIQPDFSMGSGKVVHIMENGIKPVFRLRTSLGKEIIVTGNHPFLTINGWKALEELQLDERIASPAYLPIEGKETWEDFQLVTLGWTLAEGNTCHPSGFYFYNNDYDAVQDFVTAVEQFDNTHPTIVQRADRNGIYDVYVGTGCYGRVRVGERSVVQRSGARLWLESLDLIGFKATQKSFPPEVFRLNNQCLSVLIGRFWSGDGFIASSNNTTPYLATSSLQLVTQLQHLLLRLCIVSRVTEKHFPYKEGRIGYTLHLIGRRSVEQFVRLIVPHIIGKIGQIDFLKNHLACTSECSESIDTVPGEIYSWICDAKICDAKTQLNITWEEMREKTGTVVRRVQNKLRGFRRTTVNKLAEFLDSQPLRQIAHPDIFWERVVSIEPVGIDMTYDLEIEEVHNFVANDIIVHNSHSAAYALVAYQTAWLKAHYPAAFMAAALSSDMDNTDKVVRLIDECRAMGLTIEPPHVNRSDYRFTVEKDKPLLVRYGLGAIKGAGENAIENIVEARHQKGEFQDLFDFCRRLDLKKVNRRVLEASVKAGALDKLAPSRAITLASLEKAVKLADQHSSAKATGQNDMFGLSAATVQAEKPMFATNVTEWTLIETLQFEKDVLGFYISGHPIKQYQGELEQITSLRLGNIKPTEYKAVVRIAGWVVDLRHNQSKRGKMASLTLEDMTGQFEVVVYPDIYPTVKDILAKDILLIAEGEIREDKFSGGRHMVANQLLTLEKIRETAKRLVLHITPEQANHETVLGLKNALEPYQAGKCPIYVMYQRPEAQIEIIFGAPWQVNIQEPLLNELRNLLTINNVRVIYS